MIDNLNFHSRVYYAFTTFQLRTFDLCILILYTSTIKSPSAVQISYSIKQTQSDKI